MRFMRLVKVEAAANIPTRLRSRFHETEPNLFSYDNVI